MDARDGRRPAADGCTTGFPSVDSAHRRRRRRHDRLGRRRRLAARRPRERRRRPWARLLRARRQSLRPLTDACVALGYIDPDYFLGGRHSAGRRRRSGRRRPRRRRPLGSSSTRRPMAVLSLALEQMVQRHRGDHAQSGDRPGRRAILVGGGGGGGLYSVEDCAPARHARWSSSRRLGDAVSDAVCCCLTSSRLRHDGCRCPRAFDPVSATGRLSETAAALPTSSSRRPGAGSVDHRVSVLGRGAISAPGLGDRGAAALGSMHRSRRRGFARTSTSCTTSSSRSPTVTRHRDLGVESTGRLPARGG